MAQRRKRASVPSKYLPAAAVIHDRSLAKIVCEIVEDAEIKIATANGIDPDNVLLQVFIVEDPGKVV
jgi:hypothetical protein